MLRALIVVAVTALGILSIVLLRMKDRASFLEEAALSKDRQIESLAAGIAETNKKNSELQQRLAGMSKYEYVENVLQWANNAKVQVENYLKEVEQYAGSLIRNAEIEAERISRAVVSTVHERREPDGREAAAQAKLHAASLIAAAEAKAKEIKQAAEECRRREEEIASRLARLKEREEAIARTERGLLTAISQMIRSAEEQARFIASVTEDEAETSSVGSDDAVDRTAI